MGSNISKDNENKIANRLKKPEQYKISMYGFFPDKPITKKPAEVRMGKGKGAPEYWVAVVKPGTIIFEAEGVPMEIAKEALRLAAQKLPVKTKFVIARDFEA